jgi:transposase
VSMLDHKLKPEPEPHAYLEDVITKIVNRHPNSKIDDLLPWAYLADPALKAVA